MSPGSKSITADFVDGIGFWRVWGRFGWHDIVARYRRSWMGPLWIIISTTIFALALGVVYSTLFKTDIIEYLPFVVIGVTIWGFISATCLESVQTFVEAETYIKQVRISMFVYVFRVTWRNIIIFLNHFLVALVIVSLTSGLVKFKFAEVLLGVCLLFLQGPWIVMLMGVLGTRFRDLPPIIQNVLQVMFFITPVLWKKELLGEKTWIANINPVNFLIDALRQPLLGEHARPVTYIIVIAFTILGYIMAFLIYRRFRDRIVYWL